jgi:hypothetical protein
MEWIDSTKPEQPVLINATILNDSVVLQLQNPVNADNLKFFYVENLQTGIIKKIFLVGYSSLYKIALEKNEMKTELALFYTSKNNVDMQSDIFITIQKNERGSFIINQTNAPQIIK